MANTLACPICGTPYAEGQNFCPTCGTPLNPTATRSLVGPQGERARANLGEPDIVVPQRRSNALLFIPPLLIVALLAVLLLVFLLGGFRSFFPTNPIAVATNTPVEQAALPSPTLTLTAPTAPPADTATLPPPTQAQPTVLPPTQAPSPTSPPIPTSLPSETPTAVLAVATPPGAISISKLSPLSASDHPYEGETNKTWLVAGTDHEAGATSVHFSRLELEQDVDWLVVLDVQNNEMQRFTGNYPEGLWTDPVPGDLVKLQLITDKSVQHWGFSADFTAGIEYKTLAYSPHPYPHKSDLKWQFGNSDPGAEGTRLHFSRLELEENVDWLVITGADGTPYQWITGHHPEGLWTIGVSGSVINARLISDATVGNWGFNIDNLESAPIDAPRPRPDPEKSLAESQHPMQLDAPNLWTIVNPDPDATFTKIHFSRLELARNSHLKLLDGNDNPAGDIYDSGEDLWSDDIPGRVIKVQYVNGYAGWGFRVDQVATGSSR